MPLAGGIREVCWPDAYARSAEAFGAIHHRTG